MLEIFDLLIEIDNTEEKDRALEMYVNGFIQYME